MQVIKEATIALPGGEKVIKEATIALPGGEKANHNSGPLKSWNDGKHKSVIRITVTVTEQSVNSIQFDYLNEDWNVHHAPTHGGSDGVKKWVSLDYEGAEYLRKVTTFAGIGNKIKSLTFETSKKTFSTDDDGEPWITGSPCELPKTNYFKATSGPEYEPQDSIVGFHGKADKTSLYEVIADVE